jgi:CheY-like chemotaxis protein
MLVEDDPLAAKLLELLFARRPDVVVRACGSAEEALAALRDPGQRPGVLLCDLSLPGMKGIELIRMLRQDQAWADLPILAITASTDGADPAATLSAGATAFVTKAQLCSNFSTWVATVIGMAGRIRAAV